MAINCLIFTCYRTAFLARFTDALRTGEAWRVLLDGLRLDVALLGFEFCGIGLITLLMRWLRVARLFQWLWALTALHSFICVSNFYTFAERNQNAGDLLIPYITSPYQVYLAVIPFCQQHWLLMLGLILGAAFLVWLGRRIAIHMQTRYEPFNLWHSPKAALVALLMIAMPLMMTWQPIIKQKRTGPFSGITAIFANSKYYTHFPDFRENEALINPLLEFVGVQVPTALHRNLPYRLTEEQALAEWQSNNETPVDAEYPLLKVIHGREDAKIKNVIIVQVEGLTGSMMEQEREGRFVMPYLRELARAGIYFPNTFQNANFTSGGVFSTAASIPKAAWEETTRRFANHELHGYYSSLAHVLGSADYTHYFCEGFRQSGDDFLSFMAYQGFQVLNYQTFKDRLAANNQLADSDSVLGIHDGYMMQETADLLIGCSNRFTAHLMTCTTHSPWSTPPSFKTVFQEQDLNTFAYLDLSIAEFVKRIEAVPRLRDNTLIVVLGDHTSVTLGNNLLERLRIPMILYAPGLPKLENAEAIWASQVDVLPTVLGLMEGDHPYAGMGHNLLELASRFTGIVSGTRDTGYFVTKNWVLQYHPFRKDIQLYAIMNGLAMPEDQAADKPEQVRELMDECLAQVELARRLGVDKHVYPTAIENSRLLTIAHNATALPNQRFH